MDSEPQYQAGYYFRYVDGDPRHVFVMATSSWAVTTIFTVMNESEMLQLGITLQDNPPDGPMRDARVMRMHFPEVQELVDQAPTEVTHVTITAWGSGHEFLLTLVPAQTCPLVRFSAPDWYTGREYPGFSVPVHQIAAMLRTPDRLFPDGELLVGDAEISPNPAPKDDARPRNLFARVWAAILGRIHTVPAIRRLLG